MRLIDADELLTDNTWTWFDEWGNCTPAGEIIMDAPTIDAEPVVRCKDCKHYIPSKEMLHKGWCDDALQNLFKEDFYCGFGKRREP